MSAEIVRQARDIMAMSRRAFGEMLGLTGDPNRTVAKWEREERPVPGPVLLICREIINGRKPGQKRRKNRVERAETTHSTGGRPAVSRRGSDAGKD